MIITILRAIFGTTFIEASGVMSYRAGDVLVSYRTDWKLWALSLLLAMVGIIIFLAGRD